MTQTRTETGLVRVTVVGPDRRSDLALPGAVPLAELLPELARSVGLLDPSAVHAGFRLTGSDGRVLAPGAGLTIQGVDDGSLLSLTSGVDEEPPRVYDDVVEAMAEIVEKDLRPWDPATGRRTALVAAGFLLSLGAATLAVQRVSLLAAATAAVVAVLLLVGSGVLARTRAEHEVAAVLAWLSVPYAVVAGFAGTSAADLWAVPLAAGGAGGLVAGTVGALGLVQHRAALLPAVLVGLVAALVGTVVATTALDVAPVAAVALVVVTLAVRIVPWFALGGTRSALPQAHSHAELTAEPVTVDHAQVRRDVRLGHDLLLAVTVSVGALLVLVAPLTVGLGVPGAIVAVLVSGILILRTRQYRAGSEVLAGLLSGLAGASALVLAAVVLRPEWRPTLAVLLAALGALLLVLTLVPRPRSVRWGRVGDIVEGVALVALLPLLVAATGVIEAVRG